MKKSKLLTPILMGSTLVASATPAFAMTSCSCSSNLDVNNSVTVITKKLDNKPDDGTVVTVTIEKTDGLDVEFVSSSISNAETTTTVKVNDNNEFTVYVKFVTAPTTKGTSTFNLNTTYKSGGAEKTQSFTNNKIDYDISGNFVEIKDGYSPRLSPATGWTKTDFIQKYIDKVLESNGNIFRDDLYTSSAINLKKYVDKGALVGVKKYQICLNDIISMEGVTNMFKLHMNFFVEIDKIIANKVYEGLPNQEITDIKVNVSLECPCYWTISDSGKTESDYPVIKADYVSGTGSIGLEGKITGSFTTLGETYKFEEASTTSDIFWQAEPQNFVSMGLVLIMFGEECFQLPNFNPLWVSPYCRNVK